MAQSQSIPIVHVGFTERPLPPQAKLPPLALQQSLVRRSSEFEMIDSDRCVSHQELYDDIMYVYNII